MIQVFSKSFQNLAFAQFTFFPGVSDGASSLVSTVGHTPMLFDGTMRNLTARRNAAYTWDTTVTLMKNNVDTSLTVAIPAGGVIGEEFSDAVNSFTYLAGDQVGYHIGVNGIVGFPGAPIGLSVEIETVEQMYGTGSSSGTIPVGPALVGGALGNGVLQFWGGSPTDLSNTFSICALPGAITHLSLFRQTAQAGGGWKAWIIKQAFGGVGIIQDGSGGTVNTEVDIPDGGPAFIVSSFMLPADVKDRFAVAISRYGTTAGFSTQQLAATVGFTPDVAGSFMFVGGNNSVINTPVDYQWPGGEQLPPTIDTNTAPVGQTPIFLTAMYDARGGPPSASGLDKSFVYTGLKNAGATALTATQTGLALDATIDGVSVNYAAGDAWTIEIDAVNLPDNGGQFHWGVAATAIAPVPPPECPGLVSSPRVDGLPYSPFTPGPCAGPGIRGSARTGT